MYVWRMYCTCPLYCLPFVQCTCSLTSANPKLLHMCIVQCAAHKPHMCHTQNCQDLTEKVFLITCLMVQVQVRGFHLWTSICQSLQYLFIKHLLKNGVLMSSSIHCPKNDLILGLKTEPVTFEAVVTVYCMSGFHIGPDILHVNKSLTDTVAYSSAVKGSILMLIYRLFLGQCP